MTLNLPHPRVTNYVHAIVSTIKGTQFKAPSSTPFELDGDVHARGEMAKGVEYITA